MRFALAQGGQSMRHVPDDFALVDIKMKRNAHILQVIFPARRIGTIRASNASEQNGDAHKWQPGNESDQKVFERESHPDLAREFAA